MTTFCVNYKLAREMRILLLKLKLDYWKNHLLKSG